MHPTNEHTERWKKGLAFCAEVFPFWAIHAEGFTQGITEVPGLSTAATDGSNLFYSPEFTQKLNEPQLNFVAIHEVMHRGLNHFDRVPQEIKNEKDITKKNHLFRIWNEAMDAAIHNILIPMVERGDIPNTKVPSGFIEPIYMPEHAALSAEEIYEKLRERKEEPQPTLDGHIFINTDAEGNVVSVEGTDENGNPLPKEVTDAIQKAIQNRPKKDNLLGPQRDAPLEAKDPPVFGSFERTLEKMPKAEHGKQSWLQILAEWLTKEVSTDYSWRKPNYRYFNATGIIYPGLTGEFLTGVIMIDNSGSIRHDRLKQMGDELELIREVIPDHELHVIFVDNQINKHEVLHPGERLDWKAQVRGSNDFKIPFTYVEEQNINPRFMIFFTDGEPAGGPPIPKEPPPYPVLWVMWPSRKNHYAKTPWGNRLEIPA